MLKLNQNLSEKTDLLSVKYIFVSVGTNIGFFLTKAAYWCLSRILNNTQNHHINKFTKIIQYFSGAHLCQLQME